MRKIQGIFAAVVATLATLAPIPSTASDAPGAVPPEVSLSIWPARPRAGRTVTMTVNYRDKDGAIVFQSLCVSAKHSGWCRDYEYVAPMTTRIVACVNGTSSTTKTQERLFPKPGTYRVFFEIGSSDCPGLTYSARSAVKTVTVTK